MIDKIIISGMGQNCSLGQGMSALQAGVDQKIKPECTMQKVLTKDGEQNVATFRAKEVVLPAHVPDGVARRMSRISRMCFAAASESVFDAFGENFKTEMVPSRIGLVVGTAFGALELSNQYAKRIHIEGPTGASPSLFASSVQNSIASHLSITFGIQGPSSTIMTSEQTTIGSFRLAYDWLSQNIVDHVVVVIGDEISNFHSYIMAHLPFNNKLTLESDHCTVVLGEGAVSFILSKENLVPQKKYAEVLDIQMFASKKPSTERVAVGCYGSKDQWSMHKNWLSEITKIDCHAKLYGSFLTGFAFEVAIAALNIKKNPQPIACVQITDYGEPQSMILRGC